MPATRPRPCPGRCNQTWRDAEQALATNGTPHDLTPVWGHPLWCLHCVDRFTEAVADFPRIVAAILNQALYGTTRVDKMPVRATPRAIHAWPGQPSRLLTDEIIDALTALEDDVRDLRHLPERATAVREGVTVTRAARFIAAQGAWICEYHPIADDPEDAPPAYLMRLHARAAKFVGEGYVRPETKPMPCIRCGGILFVLDGGEYIECGSCERLITEAEYKRHAKAAATAAEAHWRHWLMQTTEPVRIA